ncbi:MAG: hypothetical protein LBF71_04920 [Campylobacteraceae bacterium]|jgi:hypothetical protein|nr:hypothetical protein [Campylobacteraceae bacterium]
MLYDTLKQQTFSPYHYVSGQQALNIYDWKHNTGDWHTVAAWQPETVIGRFDIMGD